MSYAAFIDALSIPHLRQQQQQQQQQQPSSSSLSLLLSAASSPISPSSLSLHIRCSCGSWLPHLAFLFYCRHCRSLHCNNCTKQTIDTYFCPACLNSVFTTQAAANQHRCEQCMQCPICQHVLSSVQRTSASGGGGELMYLCDYCKWSSDDYVPTSDASSTHNLVSRDVGALSARVREQEVDSGMAATFTYLQQFYKARYKAQQAAAASAAAAAGNVGISGMSVVGIGTGRSAVVATAAASEAAKLADQFESLLSSLTLDQTLHALTEGSMDESSETAATDSSDSSNVGRWMAWRAAREEALHRSHYTLPTEPVTNEITPIPLALLGHFNQEKEAKPHAVDDISTLDQRLSHPSSLASHSFLSSHLLPLRHPLSSKISHRCPSCMKFLVKPAPGASKANFEFQMAAISYIPTITIGQFPPLTVGETTDLTVYFKNPVEKVMKLWLTLPSDDTEQELNRSLTSSDPAHSPATLPSSTRVDFHRAVATLAAYDDLPEENAAWQEDGGKRPEDEPELVVYRHLSKCGLRIRVTPTTHTDSTYFVLLVHVQTESATAATTGVSKASPSPSPSATSPSTSSGSAMPSPSPSPPVGGSGPVIKFPVAINLGYAQPAQQL